MLCHAFLSTGDLRKGPTVLAWLLQQKNPEAEDVIEEIKGAELEKLIDTSPSVAVFFCKALMLTQLLLVDKGSL